MTVATPALTLECALFRFILLCFISSCHCFMDGSEIKVVLSSFYQSNMPTKLKSSEEAFLPNSIHGDLRQTK